ncbi:MAG: hypothetical protein GY940_23805 [bacterium]|nr:hypothetical protein [bacterium]
MIYRKQFIVLFFIVLMVCGFGFPEDRRPDKSVLVIMTLNAEFLWDGVAPEDGRVNFPWRNSQTEAEEHMRDVARLIIQSNPDIINLVEVEGKEALDRFNSHFLAGRGYRAYFIKGKDSFTGQDVILLTRVDPENKKIERYDKKGKSGNVSKSVSKNYFAKFKIKDTKFALIGLHLLARPGSSGRKLKRQAQADAMLNLALELNHEGYEIVMAGDFNDYDGAEDSLDHINSVPITNVLDRIKKMDPDNESDDLINASSLVSKANRFTAFWDKDNDDEIDVPHEYTGIDHILLSKTLSKKIDTVVIPHNHDPRMVTDHFPVVVYLKLPGPGNVPLPQPDGQIRMIRLMPNPIGNENTEEWIEIENPGNKSVNLKGWKFRDLAGKTWKLKGTLKAGDKRIIKRNKQSMALNNRGDTVDLINPKGEVVQTISYDRVNEGEEIIPAEG